MPLSIPGQGVKVGYSFLTGLKGSFDGLEGNVSSAAQAAAAAVSAVAGKYSKPSAGIPVTDLAASGARTAATFLNGAGQWGIPNGTRIQRVAGSYAPTTLADAGTLFVFESNEPWTFTLPPDSTFDFDDGTVFYGLQLGEGQGTIRGAGGGVSTVAMRTSGGLARSIFEPVSVDYVVTLPLGIANGDGLLILLSMPDPSRTITAPAGWVPVGSPNGPDGTVGRLWKYQNATPGMSGQTVTFTLSGTGGPAFAATVAVLSGADPNNFVDGVSQQVTFDMTTPTLVTGAAGCLELALLHAGSATGDSPPALTTTDPAIILDRSFATNDPNVSGSRAALAHGTAPRAAGTTIGNRAFSGGYGGAFTLSVKPAAGASSVSIVAFNQELKTAGKGAGFSAVKIGPSQFWADGLTVA